LLSLPKETRLPPASRRVSIGSRKFVVQDGMDKVVTGVIAAKDFVGGFMASEPHAALGKINVILYVPHLEIPH
jgi:hypothetical protein